MTLSADESRSGTAGTWAARNLRLAPFLLIGGGAVLLLTGLLFDFVIGSAISLGRVQIAITLIGFSALAHGRTLTTGSLRDDLSAWRSLLSRSRTQEITAFLVIAAQVGLIVFLLRAFHIENPTVYKQLAPLVLVGFVIHHLTPASHRLSFFVLLSALGIWTIFGFANGSWLLAVGLVLIGVCHLPVRFAFRVATLMVVGAALAVARAQWLPTPWSPVIWPILGSMFMFRLVLYLYELRHSSEPVQPQRTLAYFFLLPNVAFPLFPVIDYGNFRRHYYDQADLDIYRRGVHWMARGLAHLLLYRVIYQYLVIPPVDIESATDVAQHMLANISLYLRVSGQFHLIVGMLHLFGFRLPETHRFFFLASSFTDFWRRINIYWKDFMMKVFYYPAYFRLRRRGENTALVLATLFVFLMTWALHVYQWFWILGTALLAWTDVLFWAILAVLLVGNVLYETRHGRIRSVRGVAPTLGQSVALVLRTAVTFTIVCLLWSLWTSPRLRDWLGLWPAGGSVSSVLASALLLLLLAGCVLGVAGVVMARKPAIDLSPALVARRTWVTVGAIVVLYVLGAPGSRSEKVPHLARDLRLAQLNAADAALLQRGYYEELTAVTLLNYQLLDDRRHNPKQRADFILSSKVARDRTDFLNKELRPLVRVPYRHGTLRTNRWGMRDRDYPRLPAPGTYRIALLGPSYVAGWGVSDGETFEALIEQRLNRAYRRAGRGGLEILNFSMPGYSPPQQLQLLEEKILDFRPDAAFVVVHPNDSRFSTHRMVERLSKGAALPFDYLRAVAQKADVNAGTPREEARRRLRPYESEILEQTFTAMVALCRRHAIKPVLIHLPMPGESYPPDAVENMLRLASQSGFTVLDLTDVYAGYTLGDLAVGERDLHPNVRGHRVIADRLYELLVASPDIIPAF